MKYQVPVLIEPLEEGGYYAECTILSGCHVEGATYFEALEHLEDVIRLHIEGRLEFGEPLPPTDKSDDYLNTPPAGFNSAGGLFFLPRLATS